MKIYIASTWENKEAVVRLMDELIGAGHEITLDWTTHEMFEWRGEEEKRQIAAGWAKDDIDAVKQSDAVVVLLHNVDKIRTGCSAEMGAGLALGKRVIVYGKQTHPESPFLHHPALLRIDYGINNLLTALR